MLQHIVIQRTQQYFANLMQHHEIISSTIGAHCGSCLANSNNTYGKITTCEGHEAQTRMDSEGSVAPLAIFI